MDKAKAEELILFLEELTTSPLKEINVQTRPGDYLLSIEEIVGGVMCKDSAKNYEATQGQFLNDKYIDY